MTCHDSRIHRRENAPYEVPEAPAIVLDTAGEDVQRCVDAQFAAVMRWATAAPA